MQVIASVFFDPEAAVVTWSHWWMVKITYLTVGWGGGSGVVVVVVAGWRACVCDGGGEHMQGGPMQMARSAGWRGGSVVLIGW